MEEWKMRERGSQIPAFGNWEYVNDLPITQYFECARQAGLIRYSSSSGECCDHHHHHPPTSVSPDFIKPRTVRPKQMNKGIREKRTGGTHGKEGSKKQGGKVFDVTSTELPQSEPKLKRTHIPSSTLPSVKKQQLQFQSVTQHPRKPPMPVDEDLYKIPPELLKRKKRLGFISRCLVPPCAV
ncbi:uncharacterized protein LOC130828121 isoform X2 [Amaranthus tricolor]|uniref:uncharacterized protein LOC130828121 isoform X2 n=1 Tax=Amaranthus tricolor TaxID=29722 RepID=UPI00258FA361|nr:uncharacterized protein LOC130828121 isoform X2 [Amaranthus tricolor]